MWNLLCQYNNIYAGLHKYFKEKKKNTDWLLVRKKKTLDTVATVLVEYTKGLNEGGKRKKDSRNQITVAATVLHNANTLDAQCRSIVAA